MRQILLILFMLITLASYAQKPVDFDKLPSVAWKFQIKAPIYSSPVTSDGVVYFGGLDSTIYAVNVADGVQKWKLKTNGEIRSTLLPHGDKLYLVGGNGVLSCIDKNTGKVTWRTVYDLTAVYLAERRYDFADYYFSTPVIHEGVLYFGSANGQMCAYNVNDGSLKWTFKAGDMIHSTAVVSKDKLFFGSYDGYVYALRLDGSLIWKFKAVGDRIFPRGEMNGSPAVAGNTLFIGGRDFNTYALDVNGGFAQFNKKFRAWALSYTVSDTVVYIGTSDDRLLVAMDVRSGQEYWKTDVKFNIFGGALLSPSLVYVGTTWGRLQAVDRKTGDLVWSFTTDGYNANHLKYFKSDDRFRDDIGSILKTPSSFIAAEHILGGIWSTPAVWNDRMFITTTEGTLYCLRK